MVSLNSKQICIDPKGLENSKYYLKDYCIWEESPVEFLIQIKKPIKKNGLVFSLTVADRTCLCKIWAKI